MEICFQPLTEIARCLQCIDAGAILKFTGKRKETKHQHGAFDWFTSDHDRCRRDALRPAQHNSRLRREIADICRIHVGCYWDISSRRIDKPVEAHLGKEDEQTRFFHLRLRREIHRIEIDLLVEWATQCSLHWSPDWTEDRWIPTSRETHPGQCRQTRGSPCHRCSSEVFHKGQVMQLLTKLCHTKWSVHREEFSHWKMSVLEGNNLEHERHWLSMFSSRKVSRLVLNGNVWDRLRSFVSWSASPFEQLWHPWEEKQKRRDRERTTWILLLREKWTIWMCAPKSIFELNYWKNCL